MKGRDKIFLCVLCAFFALFVVKIRAQNQSIDSLKTILKTAKQDTNKMNASGELSQLYGTINQDTAVYFGNMALSISKKINSKEGEALSEFRLGRAFVFKQNYNEAMLHYNKALEICNKLLTSRKQNEMYFAKKLIGKIYGNIAGIDTQKSEFPLALKHYIKALKFSEEVGDKQEIGRVYGNIAIVYKAQSEFNKSLEYLFKGLKLSKEVGDKSIICRILGNIASVYYLQYDFNNALKYNLMALEGAEEIGAKQAIGVISGNIANIYKTQAELFKKSKPKADSLRKLALVNFSKGVKIAEELGDRQSMCVNLGNLGKLYLDMGKVTEAELSINKAIILAKEIGSANSEMSQNQNLTTLYEKTNRPALALEHYKKYIALRDTIFSQENSKKLMRTEMDHEYEKKKAVADAEHKVQIENQKLVAAEKTKKQNIIIASVIVGLVLVMIFAGFIFRSLRITSKQKLIIEQKNAETEHQKEEIEEKQKEILDSIRYAKRIQLAQIPTEKRVSQILNRLKGHEGK